MGARSKALVWTEEAGVLKGRFALPAMVVDSISRLRVSEVCFRCYIYCGKRRGLPDHGSTAYCWNLMVQGA